ncbi:MAG: cadherin domain-containing protein, partial [Porticoccaceae bacterium]
YNFTVIATFQEFNSPERPVTLTINNLDEVAPTIISGDSADVIDENTGSGQIIYTAEAIDSGDISEGITYSLAAGSDAGLSIDSATGDVSLVADADYEVQAQYSFAVIATDAAGNASTAKSVTLDINIVDTGINVPNQVANTQHVYVSESTISEDGTQVTVKLSYMADSPSLTGIGFTVNYDSNILAVSEISNILSGAIASGQVKNDPVDWDGDSSTDMTSSFGWASLFGGWPGSTTAELATITFDVAEGATGSTGLNIVQTSTAAGYSFDGQSQQITVVQGSEPTVPQYQIVSVVGEPVAKLGDSVTIEVGYDVSDSESALTGLGLRVHYDSSILTFDQFDQVLEKDSIFVDGPHNDFDNLDNNASTDKYILSAWASIGGDWPGVLPESLLALTFNTVEDTDLETTTIAFSSDDTAVGYTFKAENYQMDLIKSTWDFDGNGIADPLTDGLLMMRYFFGFRGESMVEDTVAPESTMTYLDIEQKILDSMDILDIDDNGEVKPLTDGLMLMRYLFGFSGYSLIDRTVAPDSNRSSHVEIENHLLRHMPKM